MDPLEVDHQSEQVQIERPEDQIEDPADLTRCLLESKRHLHLEARDPWLSPFARPARVILLAVRRSFAAVA